MKIISIDGHAACCEAKGVTRNVSLSLLEGADIAVGGYVLVHVGYAIQAMTVADAQATWDLFDEITAALDHVDA